MRLDMDLPLVDHRESERLVDWPRVLFAAYFALCPVEALAQGTPQRAAPPGAAQPTAEEVSEIEKALQADADEKTRPAGEEAAMGSAPLPSAFSLQSLNPDLAFILDVAGAYFSAAEPMQTGGHDPSKTGFTLQQLEMAIGKSVDPYFRFDANLVFSQFGVEVEEAYGTTLALPWGLQARLGQFLTRFGRFNPTHPHTWDFIDQPFTIGRLFGAEGNRGLGAELSWLVPVDWYVELMGSMTDAAGESTARSFFGADALQRIRGALDFQHTLTLKQFFEVSEAVSLAWGLSAATGPNATGFANRTDIYGSDVYLKFRPLGYGESTIVSLHAEVFYRRRQVPSDLLQDVGGFAQLFWRFERNWATALRYELGTPSSGESVAPGDLNLDPDWIEDRHRVSANVTYWPTEFSRIRAQGAVDFPTWTATPAYSLILAIELSVGAHGAHVF
jgi:hypothetical protein